MQFSCSDNVTLLHAGARLYRQCIELYLDRRDRYVPKTTMVRENLEYVEILAGKIAYVFAGLDVPDAYHREVLETLVTVYVKGIDDVTGEYGLTQEEHTAKARNARRAIGFLYPASK